MRPSLRPPLLRPFVKIALGVATLAILFALYATLDTRAHRPDAIDRPAPGVEPIPRGRRLPGAAESAAPR